VAKDNGFGGEVFAFIIENDQYSVLSELFASQAHLICPSSMHGLSDNNNMCLVVFQRASQIHTYVKNKEKSIYHEIEMTVSPDNQLHFLKQLQYAEPIKFLQLSFLVVNEQRNWSQKRYFRPF
jgi:hypothetical protein